MSNPVTRPIRTGWILAVVGLALMTVVSAVSGLNVALPSLAIETGATQSQLTWIVDAYTLVFAGLLLIAGAVGDRYGRRRVLVAGLTLFALGSAAAFFLTDPVALMGARAVMGIGAAGIMPATLSVITTSFPEEQRPRAIGLWVGIAGGGAVLGLFATGILLEFFAWNSFFALNFTLAVVALIGALVFIPESREEHRERLDVVGGVLSMLAVSGIVFGVIESAERGWSDPLTIAGLATGLASLLAFVLWEMRATQPLLDPRLFRIRGFSAGSISLLMQFFAAFGFFFVSLQYLQFVVGYSPLGAATMLLPLPIVLIPTARLAPRIAQRYGFHKVVPVGLALMGAGFAVMSQLSVEMNVAVFWTGIVLFGAGMGLAGTPATTAITAALPQEKQGVASAVNDTARELGSALGIAVLGSLLASGYRDAIAGVAAGLPGPLAEAVEASIAFTQSPRIVELGVQGQVIAEAAKSAFVDGISVSITVGAIVLTTTAVLVAWRGPARPDSRENAHPVTQQA